MTVRLECTENLGARIPDTFTETVTSRDIPKVLDWMTWEKQSQLALTNGEGIRLQAVGCNEEGFSIIYTEAEKSYISIEDSTKEEIAAILQRFAAGDPDWRDRVEFEHFYDEKKPIASDAEQWKVTLSTTSLVVMSAIIVIGAGIIHFLLPAWEQRVLTFAIHFAHFFAAFLVTNILYLAGMVTIASLLRIRCIEADLFIGPPVFRISRWDRTFRLNWIPLGSGLKLSRFFFETAGIFKKTSVILAGCFAMLLVTLACLGVDQGLALIVTAFREIPSGALSPLTHGRSVAIEIIEYVQNQSFVAVVGAMTAIQFSFNVLPLPTLSGGQLLIAIWESWFPLPDKQLLRIYLIGYACGLVLCGSWAVAMVAGIIAYCS